MSRQQKRDLGTQDFRRYPLIDLEPLPDVDISSYVSRALKAKNLGSRLAIPSPSKPFVCQKTGKSYLFWDNYLLHVKRLSPLYGPPANQLLRRYRCPYDDHVFHFRDNLKLHNKVKRFEAVQGAELRRRVVDLVANTTGVEDEVDENPPKKWIVDVSDPDLVLGRPLMKWPRNYDDLPAIRLPKKPNVPAYRGWTHSDDSDSWHLEAHTPSSHEEYNKFTKELYGKTVTCPRLWDTVFPDTERAVKVKSLL